MGGKMKGASTGFALVDANEIALVLRDSLIDYGGAGVCSVAGSIRRSRQIVNDIDLVAYVDHASEEKFEKFMHELGASWIKGKRTQTQFLWKIKNERVQVDVFVTRVIDRFGAQLLCWTGSEEWNVATRQWANNKGMMLSQRGLYLQNGDVLGATEQEIFEKLGLPYLEPNVRHLYTDIASLHQLQLGCTR